METPFAVPIKDKYTVASVGQSKGELLFRGYSIHDLMTNNCCYEEVVFLIIRGSLPKQQELLEYKAKLASYTIPTKLTQFLRSINEPNMHCIDYLKIAIAYLGIIKSGTKKLFNFNTDILDTMDEIIALMPLLLLSYDKTKNLDFQKDASHTYPLAKRFLDIYHSNNPNINITEDMISCLNKTMILYTEHGTTTSAFTARVVTSSLSDVYSAICAALCAAKGSLHCGANEKALNLIQNYKREELLQKLMNKEIIEGFGHREYMRSDLRVDPRNKYVKSMAETLSKKEINPIFCTPHFYKNAVEIEQIMMDKKNLFANIDFYGPVVHYQLGIDSSLLTGMICINLCVGWIANIMEQRKKHNRLIRPVSVYTGPKLRQFIPLKSRL